MKIVSYRCYNDITVEFQDDLKLRKRTRIDIFNKGLIKNPNNKRINETNYNNEGCLMKIVKYNNCLDVTIEFFDDYKAQVHTTYKCFQDGKVKNPYYPSIFGVGMIGEKYPVKNGKKNTKEYYTWYHMLKRCYDEDCKKKYPTYENVTCCDEWLLYENFYEWLHSQENFDKWIQTDRSAIDKDILVKGNKIYSSETCCLVPQNVNGLFAKSDATRGSLPVGIRFNKKASVYVAECCGNIKTTDRYLGESKELGKTFQIYKNYKENLIKQIAQEEYANSNITKRCYEAMLNYQVEIDD